MTEESTPHYADIVLVPLANPETATSLIDLALAIAHPEEGRVIALIVSLGDTENESETIEEIEPLIENYTESEKPVELITVKATSVARGILDVVREQGVDLVVLGLSKPSNGHVMIGTIAESVAATAPCGVLIYRAARNLDFKHIIVPMDGSEDARIAARVGILMGQYYDKPVEAMYVQDSSREYWEGRGRIEATLHDIPGQQMVKRTLVTASNAVNGLLARVDDDDLLVVGFSGRSEWQRWLYGDFSLPILNRAPGPVILTSRPAEPETVAGDYLSRLRGWLNPTLTPVEQDDLVRQGAQTASATLDFTVLMMVAAVIASLGLLLNSGAVIIGAMLVAPLMSPLISFATGITVGRMDLVQRSGLTVVEGVLIALLLSGLIGVLSPSNIITDEMVNRGNPSVLDMGVALASGLIGAYATARKDIPAALAGVAIAAALVPPICTVGLGIAVGNLPLARGASLLFVTNIVSIILAAWGVFFWLGLRPRVVETSRTRQYVSAALVTIFIGILGSLVVREVNPANFEANVEETLQQALEPFSQGELVNFDLVRGDPLRVIATVRISSALLENEITRATLQEEIEAAEQSLTNALDQQVILEVVMQPTLLVDDSRVVISQQLNSTFSPSRLVRFDVEEQGESLLITTVIQLTRQMSMVQVQQKTLTAETVLSSLLERPVSLAVEIDYSGP